jgi:hypothetical protein
MPALPLFMGKKLFRQEPKDYCGIERSTDNRARKQEPQLPESTVAQDGILNVRRSRF